MYLQAFAFLVALPVRVALRLAVDDRDFVHDRVPVAVRDVVSFDVCVDVRADVGVTVRVCVTEDERDAPWVLVGEAVAVDVVEAVSVAVVDAVHEGVGLAKAYTLWSNEPTYTVPSAPMAKDPNTQPPIA